MNFSVKKSTCFWNLIPIPIPIPIPTLNADPDPDPEIFWSRLITTAHLNQKT